MVEEWEEDHDKPNPYEMTSEEHGNVSPLLMHTY